MSIFCFLHLRVKVGWDFRATTRRPVLPPSPTHPKSMHPGWRIDGVCSPGNCGQTAYRAPKPQRFFACLLGLGDPEISPSLWLRMKSIEPRVIVAACAAALALRFAFLLVYEVNGRGLAIENNCQMSMTHKRGQDVVDKILLWAALDSQT